MYARWDVFQAVGAGCIGYGALGGPGDVEKDTTKGLVLFVHGLATECVCLRKTNF